MGVVTHGEVVEALKVLAQNATDVPTVVYSVLGVSVAVEDAMR
jgi:hypothetical protein